MIDDELFHRTDGAAVTRYHDNGLMNVREYYIRGVPHCVNAPAREAWGYDGTKELEEWQQHARLHRRGGPARTKRYDNGNLEVRECYLNGELHAEDDLPAYTEWREDGTMKMQRWFMKDKHKREGRGPTLMQYHKNGMVKLCMWENEVGKLHNYDMPAHQSFLASGDLEYECHYSNGVKHRHDGPAELFYKNGYLHREVWHYRGTKTDKETVEQIVNKRIRY